MSLNGLSNFFIYPGQQLKVPGGGSGSSSNSSAGKSTSSGGYYTPVFIIKTYTLGDNVLGTYSTVVQNWERH